MKEISKTLLDILQYDRHLIGVPCQWMT